LRTVFIIALLWVSAGFLVAGNISSATATDGTVFNSTGVVDAMTGMQFTGATVTATFNNGVGTCTFVGNTCTGAGFSVSAPVGDTAFGFGWSINNTSDPSKNSLLQSLTINLKPAGGAFNPCLLGGSVTASGGLCFDQRGGNARSISDDGFGSRTLSASLVYTNAVKSIQGGLSATDLYTQVTFSFTNAFASGSAFTFLADTDLVPNPEPMSLTLVGAGLLGLGLLRARRGKS